MAIGLLLSLFVYGGIPGKALAKDSMAGGIIGAIRLLQAEVEQLEYEVGFQADIEEIRRLQYVYRGYMIRCLKDLSLPQIVKYRLEKGDKNFEWSLQKKGEGRIVKKPIYENDIC